MVSKGFLINEVDGKGEGNVIFPATFEKGSITVAVATSGKSPFMSAYLKRKISEIVSVTRKDEANKAIIASKITLKGGKK